VAGSRASNILLSLQRMIMVPLWAIPTQKVQVNHNPAPGLVVARLANSIRSPLCPDNHHNSLRYQLHRNKMSNHSLPSTAVTKVVSLAPLVPYLMAGTPVQVPCHLCRLDPTRDQRLRDLPSPLQSQHHPAPALHKSCSSTQIPPVA
jgi:hypothetical protein